MAEELTEALIANDTSWIRGRKKDRAIIHNKEKGKEEGVVSAHL